MLCLPEDYPEGAALVAQAAYEVLLPHVGADKANAWAQLVAEGARRKIGRGRYYWERGASHDHRQVREQVIMLLRIGTPYAEISRCVGRSVKRIRQIERAWRHAKAVQKV